MSRRTFRALIWLTAFLVFPVPVLGVETAWIPAGRALMLGMLSLAFVVAEGTSGVGTMIAGMFLIQVIAWALVFAAVTWLLDRGLREVRDPFRLRVGFVLAALVIGVALIDPVYVTPYSADSARTTLRGIYR